MLENSLAELAVLPGKCALVLFLSGLLFLHQIIKLDTINQSHLSLGVGVALCSVLSQDNHLKISCLSTIVVIFSAAPSRKCAGATQRVEERVWDTL